MSAAPFMQLYVADYLGDTQHLTTEQHGAYLLILMAMWRHEGKLPNDATKLARIARVSARRWHLVSSDVMEFFDVEGDCITQKRLVREHQKATSISEKRSNSGKLGGLAKALKSNEPPVASAKQMPKHSQIPEPYREKQEPNGSFKKTRGTRLPDDWIADIGFAITLGLSQAQAENEATKFREWWPAQPGQKGVKIDWNLTWKTWCRSAAERSQRSQAKPKKSAFQERHENAREQINRALGITDDDKHSDFDNGNIIDLGRANYRG
jgi:uncharacterized protein YdaU (DUF1376 family)